MAAPAAPGSNPQAANQQQQPPVNPADQANAQQELQNQMQIITQQDWDDMGKQFQNNLVQGISLQDLSTRVQEYLQGKTNNPHKTQQTRERMSGQGMGQVLDILDKGATNPQAN